MTRRDSNFEMKRLLVGLGAYLNQPVTDEQITMYAEDLTEYPVEEIVGAIKQIRQERVWSRFPLPAEIIKYAPSYRGTIEEQADAYAGKIISAISKFGYLKSEEVRKWLGEIGWEIFEQYGQSWTSFCAGLLERELGNARARLRNAGISVIGRAKREQRLSQLGTPDIRRRLARLTALKTIE